MDKIHALSGTQPHSEKFERAGVKWALETQWGEVMLRAVEKNEYYALDLEASSVFSLSLAVMAIKDAPDIKYTLSAMNAGEKMVMQITSPLEVYTYIFRKKAVDHVLLLSAELEKLKLMCTKAKERIPIVGLLKPKLWKEYSVHDIVSIFDYAFLKLTKPPIIFTNLEGRAGYCAVHDVTNTVCRLYIHWNLLPTLPPVSDKGVHGADDSWRLAYCIFPQENVAPREEQKARVVMMDESLSTYEGVDDAVSKGRQLVVYEDKVVDVIDFLERHPGTAAPLKAYIGREIGRWIYGSFKHTAPPHEHGPKAMELMKKYTVGILANPQTNQIFGPFPEGKSLDNTVWKLVAQEGLTDVHVLLKFKGEQGVVGQYQNANAMSRYVALTSVLKKKTRNFGLVFCADETVSKAHLQLLKALEDKADYSPAFADIEKVKHEHLSLVVKQKHEFSTWLSNDEAEGTDFVIRGPFVSECSRSL